MRPLPPSPALYTGISHRCLAGLFVVGLLLAGVSAAFASPAAVAAPAFSSHLHVSAERNIPPYTTDNIVFAGRSFGRMVPGMLRLRLSGPQALSLSHSTRSRTFSVSWTSGSSSMPCKLQFYTGSAWADITTTASSPLNCGAAAVNQSITLNGDGWKSSWNGTQVRILRIADSAVLGTFAQTLSCTTTSGSSSSTPNVDEDCNGSWDNTVAGAAVFTAAANGVWYSGDVQCSPRCGGITQSNCYFNLYGSAWDSIGTRMFDDNLNPPSSYLEWARCEAPLTYY